MKQIRRQFPLYGTELQEEDYRDPPAHYFGVPAVGVRSADALEAAVMPALRQKVRLSSRRWSIPSTTSKRFTIDLHYAARAIVAAAAPF